MTQKNEKGEIEKKTTLKLVRFTNFDSPTNGVFERIFRKFYVVESQEYKEREALLLE